MENKITKVIVDLFVYTDERKWEEVQNCLDEEVLLDYTSLAGGVPEFLTPDQIVENWKSVLPGFLATQHSISNFQITIQEDIASACCYGTAVHYLPTEQGQSTWTVVGTYDFQLKHKEGEWKINKMKLNLKWITGNKELPSIAQKKVEESQFLVS